MTGVLASTALALLLCLLGYWVGAVRVSLWLLAMAVAGSAALFLGPVVHDGLAALTGWDHLAGLTAACAAVYLAASAFSLFALRRLSKRPASRLARAGGAGLGLAASLTLWAAFFAPLPRSPSFEPVGWVQAPFSYLRAIRVLRTLSAEETEWLGSRPEFQGLTDCQALRRLVENEGLLMKFEQAAGGDRLAILDLALDPQVKRAMDEPEFLDRVRQVDPLALAEAVLLRRAGRRSKEGTSDGHLARQWGHAVGKKLEKALALLGSE